MLAHGASPGPFLAENSASSSSLPVTLQAWQPPACPLPPAMPGAVLLLQLLVSSYTGDLHAITDVIRNDVGLTVRLFRLAGLAPIRRSGPLSVEELVVQVGVQNLRDLATDATLLPPPPVHHGDSQPWERFWTHARLTGRIAEGLAVQSTLAVRQSAYVAGLLRHLSVLPELLAWNLPGWDLARYGEVGNRLAAAWHLPEVLADVIRGDDKACGSRDSYALLVLADMADERARRWESRCAETPLGTSIT